MKKYKITEEVSAGGNTVWHAYEPDGFWVGVLSFESAEDCEKKLRAYVASKADPKKVVKEIEL